MSCEVTIDPGRLPEVILPDALLDPESKLIAWARPSDLLYQDCRFEVGPAIPGAGPPITTVPYELLLRKNAVLTATGKSIVDAIAMATYMIQALNTREGIYGIGVRRVKLRPVLCGCPSFGCKCLAQFDRIPLPSNTCEVTLVTVDGLPLLPAPAETITATSDARIGGVGTSTLSISASATSFVGTYTTVDSRSVIHTRPFRGSVISTTAAPYLNPAGATWDGLSPVSISLPTRPRWAISRDPNGTVYLARINPFAVCAATCPCVGSTPDATETYWPRNQRRDLPDWEACTLAVTLTTGHPVPSACRRAVAALATRISKEMANEECPPTGAREGMSWAEIKRMVLEGSKNFGLTEVADWLNVAPKARKKSGLNLPTLGQIGRK